MGLTYYWRRPLFLDAEQFKLWSADIQLLMRHLPEKRRCTRYFYKMGKQGTLVNETRTVPLQIAGNDGAGKPTINESLVSFNGKGDTYSHEPFIVSQELLLEAWHKIDAQGRYMELCKTARKPYDLLVCAALIRFAERFGDAVVVSSDGVKADWEEAQQLCVKVFGKATIPATIRG